MDRYEEYFNTQVGCGYSGGVGRVYMGSPYQRGHGGIGSFLAGIFRRVLPLLTRGAKAVGKEALRSGMNIVSDVTMKNTPIKESFRKRVRQSGEILKRKAEEKLDNLMEGSGYKRARHGHPFQLQLLGGPGNIVKRKKTKKKTKKGIVKKRKKTRRGKPSGVRKGKKNSSKKKKKRTTRDIFDS